MAWKIQRANAWLKCDQSGGGPAWTDERIAEAFGMTTRSLENWRKTAVEQGPLPALERRPCTVARTAFKLEVEQQARLVKLACSPAPADRRAGRCDRWRGNWWSWKSLFDLSRDCAADPSENDLKPWRRAMWCIPPEQDAALVCQMEQVLEVYQQPYAPRYPVICRDEQLKQLIAESRPSLLTSHDGSTRSMSVRVTCNVWMFAEPLGCWREATVTSTKTALAWARQMQRLVDQPRFSTAEVITLVFDNLHTHTLASLYATFAPAEALCLVRKSHLVHTSKHGTWLNIAECELSALTRRCLDRHIADPSTISSECLAWCDHRNATQTGADWHFTTATATAGTKLNASTRESTPDAALAYSRL